MGIKFSCPNGHKLNVKTFLAGKRAICPKCGARVIVPQHSEGEQTSPGDSMATDSALTASTSIEIVIDETAAHLQASPPTRIVEAAPPKPAAADAIAEAPGAVWYVRPSTGGQFGPASADVMRSWLDDGRVSATSLVWRAGWADWQSAAAVFPQLSSTPEPPGVAPTTSTSGMPVLPAIDVTATGTPSAGSLPQGYVVQTIPMTVDTATPPRDSGVSPLSSTVLRRRRQRDMRLYASGVLAVVSLILMIVLFVVFRRGEQPSSAETAPAADSSTN